jgi:hypothetical protein
MIEVDWRITFIDYIQEHKLPLSVDPKSVEATRILRNSKWYVLVGGNLYKRGSASGILMKCVCMEERREILLEIHEGVCGNHAASCTLVGKASRSGFYWPIELGDAKTLVRRCTNCQFFSKQPHIPAHNLITCNTLIFKLETTINFDRILLGSIRFLFHHFDFRAFTMN